MLQYQLGTVDINLFSSLLYLYVYRYIECVGDCEAALFIDPKLYRLHVRRGKALLRVGDLLAAEESLTRVLEIDVVALNAAASGQKLSASTVADLETAKTEARSAIKTISGVKASLKQLTLLEAREDHKGVLRSCEELAALIPGAKVVHAAKSKALVKMQRFQDTKAYIESIICNAAPSTLALHAHPAANTSSRILSSALEMSESSQQKAGPGASSNSSTKNSISIDTSAMVNALLCMGPELAKCYIPSIKNIDECRTCCADVMDKVCIILAELCKKINPIAPFSRASLSGKDVDWNWAPAEYARVKELIDCKNIGDRNFRANKYSEAAADYFRAIQVYTNVLR